MEVGGTGAHTFICPAMHMFFTSASGPTEPAKSAGRVHSEFCMLFACLRRFHEPCF